MSISERALVRSIRKRLEARGYWVLKLHGGPYMPAGLPDLLAIRDGRATWIEVKLPGETPTAIQWRMMEVLSDKAGCRVAWVTSLEQIDEVIDG